MIKTLASKHHRTVVTVGPIPGNRLHTLRATRA